MRRSGVLVVMFVVSSSWLAGCTDAPDTAPPDDGGQTIVDPTTGQRVRLHSMPVAFAGDPLHHVETEDGTFELGQHWTGLGEFLDEAGQATESLHARDITDKVPKGVPVRLIATLDADLQEGDLDLWFNVPNNEIWASTFDAPFGGYSRAEYTIVHTSEEPIEVVVFYDEAEPVQTFDYVLTYEIVAEPDVLPAGVPVTVPVPSGSLSLEARWNATGAPLWVWGPDDGFLGRFVNGTTVNVTTQRPGDYVLLLPEGSPGARVRVFAAGDHAGPPLSFGLLGQDIRSTEAEPIAVNEGATLTFEAERVPLQVGLEVRFDEVMHDFGLRLESPEGELLSGEVSSTLPFTDLDPDGSGGFTFLTDVGVEGLAAGTYTGTFTGDVHGNGALFGWIVYYAR